MHEYSIAYDIYATAKRAAEDNFATKVKKVHVGVGKLTMINPEQVVFLFETMCEEDPVFKDCKIKCTDIPVKSECHVVTPGTRDLFARSAGNFLL